MKKLFPVAFLLASLLQYQRTSAQTYTASACKDGRVRLNCRIGTINITEVVLGDSRCYGSGCCPRANDCRGAPSTHYRSSVQRSCDGQSSCSVSVEIINIGCGLLAPSNDYVNITYSCQVSTTTTTPATTTPVRAVVFVQTPKLNSETPRGYSRSYSNIPTEGTTKVSTVQVTSFSRTMEETGEKSKEPFQSKTKTTEELRTHYTKEADFKPEVDAKPIEAFPVVQQQTQNVNHAYLDRMTIIVALIVAGVVLTVTVISIAVVVALKKRRAVKSEEHYDMPDFSCSPENGEDLARNSNFYDFIPEVRDSGVWLPSSSSKLDDAAKENDYLKPVMDDEERPYIWIP